MVDDNSSPIQWKNSVDSDENISDCFICCVCLDLLHKPIVLSCGHVSCFWCVHKCMNGLRESQCPYCRHPYHHFPSICQMLHFLLLKLYPLAYKRREEQILEEEKQMDCFSPQLDATSVLLPDKGLTGPSLLSDTSSAPCFSSQSKLCDNAQQNRTSANEENNLSQTDSDRICCEASIADVLCSACKQLLFQPAVLNCGHVYCQACIVVPEREVLKCQVCGIPHPSDFPKVCLEFSRFLEEKFPVEYALRRDAAQGSQTQLQEKTTPACSTNGAGHEGILPAWGEDSSKVHLGAGCDSCGMYPIVGDRYRCKDCVELIGFDLCGDCYNTRSKLPGRFNQQHTPDHQFELAEPFSFPHNILFRLIAGSPDDGSSYSVYGSEDMENGSTPLHRFARTFVPAPASSNDNTTSEDQNDREPPC